MFNKSSIQEKKKNVWYENASKVENGNAKIRQSKMKTQRKCSVLMGIKSSKIIPACSFVLEMRVVNFRWRSKCSSFLCWKSCLEDLSEKLRELTNVLLKEQSFVGTVEEQRFSWLFDTCSHGLVS
jgi:hypothetical protein